MAEVNGMRIAVLKRTATARVTGIVRGFQHQSEFTIPTQVEEKGMTFRVTEIDDAAFRNCRTLTSITIPEGIVRIGKLAFAECSSLTSITIPKTVTQIESGRVDIGDNYYYGHLFTNCPSLTSIVVEAGNPKYKTTQNGNGIIDKTTSTLIAGDQTTIIPDSVTSIGDYAFASCDALTSITIPDSVRSIRTEAFRGCRALTSVTIPNSVTSIRDDAFYECRALTSVTIDSKIANRLALPFLTYIHVNVNNPNYCSRSGVLFDKNQTKLIHYPRGKQGAYIIPDSVTSIEDCAFESCDALTSITIPDSVTSIGGRAFCGCDKLTSITISNSVTSIEERAFCYCYKLTSITIPNSVTSIGRWAFRDCYRLTSVTIENEEGTVAIDKEAFPSTAKINYVGKPKEQPAKPAEKEIQQTKSQPTPEVRKAKGSFIDRIKNFFK